MNAASGRLAWIGAVLAIALLGCGEPRRVPHDAGPDGSTDHPQDKPGDQVVGTDGDGPGADADVAPDGAEVSPDAVVVAPPGTVSTGKPCSGDNDCSSGFCRDDVCCADSCEGVCRACSAAFTGLDNGMCGPVVAGMDPRGVCTDESGTAACGRDGTCDGEGACRKQGPDHVCAAASCSSDGKFMASSTCDGKGTCNPGTTMSCGQYACAITGCAKPCAADNECPDGNYCANGTCKIKKIAGESCDNQNQCGSGNCSPDKVCCDSACTGACMACTEALTGQKNGTCAAVQPGKDPKDDCTADAPTSCGHDGTCDGKGGCRNYSSSVSCGAAGCAGSLFTPAGVCDGKGGCAAGAPVDCAQALCTLNGCKVACTTDLECATGSYCVTMTQGCATKKGNGVSCQAGRECSSGACVDGVCCESACQGKCYACSAEKTGQANGRCLPISAGSDPDTECASSDPTSCGLDGACDGTGQCRKWPTGTQCALSMCTADNKFVATRACDGNGTCAAATPEDCGSSACALSGCKKTCAGNQDCTGNNYCDNAVHTCAAQKSLGAACAGPVECLSQSCVDGVCCESACQGKCYACSNAKTLQTSGRCQPVAAGQDPDAECDSSDSTTCGQDGTCDGAGQCRKWPATTPCGAAACSSNMFQPAKSCNGSGSCVTPSLQNCGGAACDATSGCKTTCANDGDCVGGNYCDTGAHTCAAKKGLGSGCASGVECTSTFCAPDGVCCNSACGGTCQACVKEKTGLSTSGTCGAIPANSDPDNECTASDASTCGLDGTCDGNGQCKKWTSGTQCVAAACSSNMFTAARTCDGNGTCGPQSPQNCAPSLCSASGCKKSCTTVQDCTSGNYCDSGTMMCAALKNLGTTCGGPGECASGICVDGVCCNVACDKACQACNLASSKGTCSPVSGNPPTGHPTCAGTDSSCSGTCTGSADGLCTFSTSPCGTCKSCSAGACKTDINQMGPGCNTMCDGTGACLTPAVLALAPVPGSSTTFGTVAIGMTVQRSFVVTNSGQQDSTAITISISGADFMQSPAIAGDCSGGTPLAGNAQCVVRINLTPTSTGQKSGSLMIGATVGGTPPVLALSGMGKQPTGAITEFNIPPLVSGNMNQAAQPTQIVAGPDGNLWFLDVINGRIFRATPSGGLTPFNIQGSNFLLLGIAAGSDGNIWYTNGGNLSVGRLTPTGTKTEFTIPIRTIDGIRPRADSIRQGSDGNMWFLTNDLTVGRVSLAGVFNGDFQRQTTNPATGLTLGPDSNLWFFTSNMNGISKISPAGVISDLIGSPQTSAAVAGPDGNIWLALLNGAIGRMAASGSPLDQFPLPSANSQPFSIVAGTDGNLWCTEQGANKIARITPTGAIVEFSLPTPNSIVWGIAAGSDGNIWFTETGSSKLGKISP